MRGHRFQRPIFGPFRRKAKTGVPADHFPKASEMLGRHGDGQHVLVADGEDRSAVETWWFPTEQARQEFADACATWASTSHGGQEERDKLLLELGKVNASREQIDNGCIASVATGSPPTAGHEDMTGPHSHQHSHGDGTTHQHTHFHNNSNVHNHAHPDASFVDRDPSLELHHAAGCDTDKGGTAGCVDGCPLAPLVASAYAAAGGIEALNALRTRKGLTAAVAPDGTVTAGEWHSYLTVEGLITDDRREFPMGCFSYEQTPLSARLLIEDEGGHWGAVTCGRIDTIEPRDFPPLRAHYSEGVFGTDETGQLAELMVEEQTQRFVSVDMRDIECEYIEVVVSRTPAIGLDYDDGPEYEYWLRYVSATIGAMTIVPMPAMPQAVIAPRSMALQDPVPDTSTKPALPLDSETVDEEAALAASAASTGDKPILPRAEWFDDPGFHLGDPRLVLQEDEKSYACPLTIGDPDPDTGLRPIYGHVAWWNCEHTGFPGQKIHPPRSETAYAYYLTAQGVACADGKFVAGVGNVTMGCGHAPTYRSQNGKRVAVGAQEAIAHYDGGYGAVQAATVRAGQDDFGPWVAGFIRPGITDDQVAELMTLNLSGDWREIGGRLDMVAVLAVPVPGFPIRRQIAASGAPEADVATIHAAIKGDRVLALVAAGVVRRVDPVSRIAHLERTLGRVGDRLEALEAAEGRRAVAAAKDRFGI